MGKVAESMSYLLKRSDILDFASTTGAEVFEKGNELFWRRCPYCNGGTHDKNTFSVNLESGAFKCFRSSCGKQGHFVELCRDFNYPLDMGEPKTYRKLPQKPVSVTSPAVDYMASRGIGQAVTERYKITTRKDNNAILAFPFYDDRNILQFVKYRNARYNGKGNKEWCEKDTKPILFGMAQCNGFERLIITEGQIDSLSVAEWVGENAAVRGRGRMAKSLLGMDRALNVGVRGLRKRQNDLVRDAASESHSSTGACGGKLGSKRTFGKQAAPQLITPKRRYCQTLSGCPRLKM